MATEPRQLTDDDLDALRNREPRAVEQWFRENADSVYAFAYYRVGKDPDLASDVVQETFLAALRRIAEYDAGRGPMIAWLICTCRNCIRKVLLEKGRLGATIGSQDGHGARLAETWRTVAAAPLPEEIVGRQETLELVGLTLANMPDNYRQVLHEHYFERRSLHELANTHQTTEGAIKSLLHRARVAFKTGFLAIADALCVESP